MNENNLIDLKIKSEYFNTKYLFYNYYQFNNYKKIPIHYRTPYCIIDGIYLETFKLQINKIIKHKHNNKFIIQFIIHKSHPIIKILLLIDNFNINFFKKITLTNSIKKNRTLKNLFTRDNNNLENDNNLEENDNNLEENDNNLEENDNNLEENDNNLEKNEMNDKYKIENERFTKINSFINKNKTYLYKSFFVIDNENYLLNCEIKPEYCDKLLTILLRNFSILSDDNINNINTINEKIDTTNEIIKLSNYEYFKFNLIEKEWDISNWNINLNINLKTNIFEICNIDENKFYMLWKICSFQF